MSVWLRALRVWLPIAVAVTACCALIYLGVQQSYRMGLNDPQVQLAEDGAASLGRGASPESVAGSPTVDARASLAPFVIVFGRDNAVLASSATLDGASPRPPVGVLETARRKGSNRVTWQPKRGVRIASVSMAAPDGRIVLAGRNMREVEARISQFGLLALVAWLAALAGVFVVAALVELAARPELQTAPRQTPTH